VNPGTWEITNKWEYKDEFVDILPSMKHHDEFTIVLRKKKNSKSTNSLTFSSPFRSELLTHAQKFRDIFSTEPGKGVAELFTAKKIRWTGGVVEVILSPGAASLDQHNYFTKKILGSYDYKDITSIDILSDVPGGFAINCLFFFLIFYSYFDFY